MILLLLYASRLVVGVFCEEGGFAVLLSQFGSFVIVIGGINFMVDFGSSSGVWMESLFGQLLTPRARNEPK